MGSIFEQEGGRDAIRVQFGEKQNLPQLEQKDIVFVLDCDYSLSLPDAVKIDKVDEWLITAHTNLETTFEEVLTEKTRAMFDK